MNLIETRLITAEIIQEAGSILKRRFEFRDFDERSKGGVDFVTQADEEVDSFLLDQLKTVFPNTNFLTEETAPEDYSHLAQVDNLWVIDPLDGTTNFSRGDPNFGISVGLVDKGVAKLAIIYLPMTNKLLWAQEDQDGAFLNGERIYVSSTSELKKTVITTDWPHNLDLRKFTVYWQERLCTHVRTIQISGSAVSALSKLAWGHTDVFIHPGVKPWDVAAGSLLVTKAGGKVTRSDGTNWNLFDKDIFASNSDVHDLVSQVIRK